MALSAASTDIAPGKSVSVTASFGVTSVNFANVAARFPQEAVIELADQLLYAAKRDGRNTVKALEFYGRPGLHVAARVAG